MPRTTIANVRVTDNGKQCIYEAGAKKIFITNQPEDTRFMHRER